MGLRHAGYVLSVTEIKKDSSGDVIGVVCTCTEVDKVATKPKAFIHWVSEPVEIEVRLYSTLWVMKTKDWEKVSVNFQI